MSENNDIRGEEQTECKTSIDMKLKPVGIIKNKIEEPFLVAGDGGLEMRGKFDATMDHVRETRQGISEIVIDESLVDILDGIEEYSHLVVLYWAHKVPEQGRSLTKVHPMGRKDIPSMGVFSTCSPARPNPVLMTVVRLCGRKENVLEVSGLDSVDGSPVVDIKPYVKNSYPQEEVTIPDWMEQLQNEADGLAREDVSYSREPIR